MSFFSTVGKLGAVIVNASEVASNKATETVANTTLAATNKVGEVSKTLPTNMEMVGKTLSLTFKLGQVEGLNKRKEAEKTIKGLDSQIAKLDKVLGKEVDNTKGKSIAQQLAESYTANRK